MTKAFGGSNHFGKKSCAQVVTTGTQMNNHSPSSKKWSVNGLRGLNPPPAKQWNGGTKLQHSSVSHKVSAQSPTLTIVHKYKGTSTKVLYKHGDRAHLGRQASINFQGKSNPSCSTIKNNQEQGIPVYNRYHTLQLIDDNGDNNQSGTIDKSDYQQQNGFKNTSSVKKKTKIPRI